MITMERFSNISSDWLTTTICVKIPREALVLRGAIRAGGELMRLRPDMLYTALAEKFPMLTTVGILKDGEVDTEALSVSLPVFFEEVKEFDMAELIPGFAYKVDKDDIHALCKMFARHEGASVVVR